jgi:hypothetical protein
MPPVSMMLIVKRSGISLTVAGLLFHAVLAAQAPFANYEEDKVGEFELPDPLTFNNGKLAHSAKDWTWRQSELLQLVCHGLSGKGQKC